MRQTCLIKINNKEVTISCGVHCFPIENGKVIDEYNQRLGCAIKNKLEEYEKCFQEAKLAFDLRIFDSVQEN